MATNILFLNPSYFKENSIVDDNVDDKIILSSILEAQEFYIKPLLGSALYNDMVLAITNNTLSANYRTLIEDYIRPTLKYWTLYEAILILNFKFTNLAVAQLQGTNEQSVAKEDVSYLRGIIKNKATIYSERSKNYLLAHTNIYTLYAVSTGEYDNINSDTTSQFDCPVYFGRYSKDYGKKWR